ncbi:ThuA domain-containing protein [Cellulosimicrobium arenosum]|uniref:ThuA domain-containing protein n=1 Tax=Cellulosimicrobium arenosum TaxID=2708133 RepID=A0A927J1H2_9MICO|nr:ThuA domain-containing protein [Cellulosimicrobium arenosum]MBD8080153.1 ThuA domain-containing protein [Cellulosimicrobium arenosum]
MTEQDRRALVVRGGWPGHAPDEAAELFVPFLESSGFDVTLDGSLESYADTSFMAGIDLVVQCWTMGEILPDEIRGLRTAVANGTGFAGWHGGVVDSFRLATDYLQMVGGQFAAHAHDLVDHTVEVVPERADHPIVAGLGPITLRSEQYWVLTDSYSDVLATTAIEPQEGDPWLEPVVVPAVWTRRWGAGKVFVSTTGHQLADLENPSVRTIVERGLLWAAR